MGIRTTHLLPHTVIGPIKIIYVKVCSELNDVGKCVIIVVFLARGLLSSFPSSLYELGHVTTGEKGKKRLDLELEAAAARGLTDPPPPK